MKHDIRAVEKITAQIKELLINNNAVFQRTELHAFKCDIVGDKNSCEIMMGKPERSAIVGVYCRFVKADSKFGNRHSGKFNFYFNPRLDIDEFVEHLEKINDVCVPINCALI